MNEESIGLIIFALAALAAVFAFILVLGGPEHTGQLSGTQRLGTSYFKYRDAMQSCATPVNCEDGLPGIPTGEWVPDHNLYKCRCQTSDPTFEFWRSPYRPG